MTNRNLNITMKKIFLLTLGLVSTMASAQQILGSYSQSVLIAPDEIAVVGAVEIIKDATVDNKIWVSNLLGTDKISAVLNTQTEVGEVYIVPEQVVNGYTITFGCLVYNIEEQQLAIALNNESSCPEIAANVSITGTEVSTNTTITTESKVQTTGVSIEADSSVVVDSGKLLEGIQYIGEKVN